MGDFPVGPVVKTELPLQGAQVRSLVGELMIPYAVWYGPKHKNKKREPMEASLHS